MKAFKIPILFLCMFFCVSVCHANEVKSFKSPNGKFSALITTIQKSNSAPPEFKIEITGPGRQLTAKSNYTSENGEQGFSLDTAAWTPDSRFFVFTTFSSGGHMGWRYFGFFFDCRDKKIHDFGDFLPPVAEGAFELKAPDIITITIWTPLTRERPMDDSIELPITFHMSDLKKSKKLP